MATHLAFHMGWCACCESKHKGEDIEKGPLYTTKKNIDTEESMSLINRFKDTRRDAHEDKYQKETLQEGQEVKKLSDIDSGAPFSSPIIDQKVVGTVYFISKTLSFLM